MIRDAYDRLQLFDKLGITDDAMVVEEMGDHAVHMFPWEIIGTSRSPLWRI